VLDRQQLLKRFGMVVRRHRDALGIAQEELAHRARLHRTYISLVERGLRNPTLQVLQDLARALQVTMTQMVAELEAGSRNPDKQRGSGAGPRPPRFGPRGKGVPAPSRERSR
jgi:transcriptional regulator with XRE-family HTH domain